MGPTKICDCYQSFAARPSRISISKVIRELPKEYVAESLGRHPLLPPLTSAEKSLLREEMISALAPAQCL